MYGLHPDIIYEFNKKLILSLDTTQNSHLDFFIKYDSILINLENDLIIFAGGYKSATGSYHNYPAKEYVNRFFYERDKAKALFNKLEEFKVELYEVYPETNFKKIDSSRVNILKVYYNLESEKMIFKGMPIDEAIRFIDIYRSEIAFEQTKYLKHIITMPNN